MKPALLIFALIAVVGVVLVVLGDLDVRHALLAFLALVATITAVLVREERRPPTVLEQPAESDATLLAPLRQVVETLPDPVIVVDVEGLVVVHNDQASRMIGALRTGQNVSGAIRAPVVLDALQRVLDTAETVQVDYEQRVPLERHFEVYITSLPLEHEDGDKTHGQPAAMLLMRDLTQQERVERMRADFVAYASHELRTPLAAVLGFIETLQGAAKNDPKAHEEFLELMRAQALRMTRLIEDLLSLSRIELNAHVRPDTIVDLERAVRHVLEYLAPMAADSGMEITTDFQAEDAAAPGDWDELVQVVQNLIENAMKYGQTGKRVDVTIAPSQETRAGEPAIELRVRDYGPGIAPEHLPRLTERFYRVDVAQSRAKGGTGLGLAIVKHIVNRHGGRLLINSKPGEGSEFIVRLQQAPMETEAGRFTSAKSLSAVSEKS